MEVELRQLVPFLRDRNPQVRHLALSNLISHTPEDAPYRNIFFEGLQGGGMREPKENDVIRDLKLLCRDQLSVAHDAFRALVNLSDSPLLVPMLSELSFLTFVVSYIINRDAILADLASMLLSNLTASSTACSTLLALRIAIIPKASVSGPFYPTQSRCGTCPAPVPYPTGEEREILALPLLVDAFVQAARIHTGGGPEQPRKGDLHFLASVFANLSSVPSGRNFFLAARSNDHFQADSDLEYPLAKIILFTEHENVIRRRGVSSTAKNCAFHVQAHRAILSPSSLQVSIPPCAKGAPGIDVLPYIVLPLAGPEEFDFEDQEKMPIALQFLPPTKTREPDSTIRLMLVETLVLLCTTRWGRDYLRNSGVYEVVRAAHMVETNSKVSEQIERLVNLVKGEEKPGNSDEAEGLATASDEDDKIEEV